jgi:ABC-type oligopeptide transport system ATPase subunit
MLLEALHLKKSFKKGHVQAVRDVSFSIEKGRTLGVVGESGSGKSTLAKLASRLMRSDEGELLFEGTRITHLAEKELKNFRKKVQMVFQNPVLSLDPRMTVAEILSEPFLLNGKKDNDFLRERVKGLLSRVELQEDLAQRVPLGLSGGECQRVAIARAISQDPELLICDEPVSSLDLLSQARILNLLLRIQKERKVSYLFITHDLRVARHISDEILVMKDGEVCETAPSETLFKDAKHPYTQSLIKQIPCQDKRIVLN